MAGKIIKSMVVILMLSGIAFSGYLWSLKLDLDKEIVFLGNEIKAGKRRIRAVQKKYSREKAKSGTCMRAKFVAETQKNKLQKQIKILMSEKEILEVLNQKNEKKYLVRISVFEKNIEKLKRTKERLESGRQKLQEKYRSILIDDREKKESISVLESEKKELESMVNQTEKRLERTRKHNGRLCVIAEELTKKYREKSGNGEPFTKIGMIELEHLVQNYVKRIDKEKIIEDSN